MLVSARGRVVQGGCRMPSHPQRQRRPQGGRVVHVGPQPRQVEVEALLPARGVSGRRVEAERRLGDSPACRRDEHRTGSVDVRHDGPLDTGGSAQRHAQGVGGQRGKIGQQHGQPDAHRCFGRSVRQALKGYRADASLNDALTFGQNAIVLRGEGELLREGMLVQAW